MSRVGNTEIKLPASVTMTQNGNVLSFKGASAVDNYTIPEVIKLEKTDAGFKFAPINDSKQARSLWGTTQRNVANIVKGLDQGFTRNIDLVGVGYRASVAGNKLTLQLGFSHDINYTLPEGITVKCDKPTSIVVSGRSKELVGQVAAYLATLRPPEPYKGKGVIRENVFVNRKEGKKK
jgi:large subunit ribosomal protein L6